MSGKKRGGQNATGNATAQAVAANGGGAKRAPAAGPKKTKPVLTAGLHADLPAQPGPWLHRCIERWGLVAPYDPAVTEVQWEAYFCERAALEWHTDTFIAQGRERDSDGDEGGPEADGAGGEGQAASAPQQQGAAAAVGAWPFDWQKPTGLAKFCNESYGNNEAEELDSFLEAMRSGVQRVLGGCKGVQGGGGRSRPGCFPGPRPLHHALLGQLGGCRWAASPLRNAVRCSAVRCGAVQGCQSSTVAVVPAGIAGGA